jgi:hypothetical protein
MIQSIARLTKIGYSNSYMTRLSIVAVSCLAIQLVAIGAQTAVKNSSDGLDVLYALYQTNILLLVIVVACMVSILCLTAAFVQARRGQPYDGLTVKVGAASLMIAPLFYILGLM